MVEATLGNPARRRSGGAGHHSVYLWLDDRTTADAWTGINVRPRPPCEEVIHLEPGISTRGAFPVICGRPARRYWRWIQPFAFTYRCRDHGRKRRKNA
jgi:hypothetical protein